MFWLETSSQKRTLRVNCTAGRGGEETAAGSEDVTD